MERPMTPDAKVPALPTVEEINRLAHHGAAHVLADFLRLAVQRVAELEREQAEDVDAMEVAHRTNLKVVAERDMMREAWYGTSEPDKRLINAIKELASDINPDDAGQLLQLAAALRAERDTLQKRVDAWQAHDDAIRAALTAATPSDKARDVVGSIEQLAAERDTFRRERDEAREALGDMVWQFAYDGVKGGVAVLSTGGLSALEHAFRVLGLPDPTLRDAALAPKEPPRGDQT
jgi:hypothetical protein